MQTAARSLEISFAPIAPMSHDAPEAGTPLSFVFHRWVCRALIALGRLIGAGCFPSAQPAPCRMFSRMRASSEPRGEPAAWIDRGAFRHYVGAHAHPPDGDMRHWHGVAGGPSGPGGPPGPGLRRAGLPADVHDAGGPG